MVTIKVVTLTPTFALVWQEKALGLFLFANFFENKTVWVTFLLRELYTVRRMKDMYVNLDHDSDGKGLEWSTRAPLMRAL